MKTLKIIAALVAVVAGSLLASSLPAMADSRIPVSGFTPDGVNFIPGTGFDGESTQVLSYLNGANYSPDGISNLRSVGDPTGAVVAMFTPDGVNSVAIVDGPAVVRPARLAYLNGGNFSPDGVSNLQDAGQRGTAIVMCTPDGVNQIENVDGPAVARTQVLAYLNRGNHSPDGVSNLQGDIGHGLDMDNLAYLYAETSDPAYVG